jgi:hypothetical protein
MRVIIEARVESNDAGAQLEPIRLAVIERDDDDLETVGLSLDEGRALMAAAQSAVVSNQATRYAKLPRGLSETPLGIPASRPR